MRSRAVRLPGAAVATGRIHVRLRPLLFSWALAVAWPLAGCGAADDEHVESADDELVGMRHLGFGTPEDGFSADDHVIVHPQLALSYNRFRNGPNWVSWVLTASDFGDAGRWEEHFFPDPKLPADFNAVQHWDYGSSGFDRGHLVRSDERTRTVEDNKVTFQTTNILPQQHKLNVGPWLRFENYCKRVVTEENADLYIIAGGVFSDACATNLEPGGNAPSEACLTIGKSRDPARRIAVPDKFFKIAVHLPRGRRLSAIDEDTRITVVLLANDDPEIYDVNWVGALTTVDAIEELTGYDFLSKVDPELQRTIERRADVFSPPP